MEQEPVLNAHNKEEYPPMHTTRFDTSLINKYIQNTDLLWITNCMM